MKSFGQAPLFVAALVLAALVGSQVVRSQDPPAAELRAQAQKLGKEGNWNDSYQAYRKLLLNAKHDPAQAAEDLPAAVQCLQQLARDEEIDKLIEDTVVVHAKSWRVLQAASQSYMQIPKHGFIVAGEFYRGNKRGGGRYVMAMERDRVRALQLMKQAMDAGVDGAPRDKSQFFLNLGNFLLNNRGFYESWRLQYVTDLSKLPDYEEGWYGRGEGRLAPVDEKGEPIYHKVGKSFDESATDGERWRWALVQAMEADASRVNEVQAHFGQFLHQQFGVQTMAQYGWFFNRPIDPEEKKEQQDSPYTLHTLKDAEAMAKLATGIKRWDIPEEFNELKVWKQIADSGKSPWGEQALGMLAQIYSDRRQYPQAATYWQRTITEYGDPHGHKQQQLDQIVKNWGQFEFSQPQPTGAGPTVEYRFRNGKQVAFEAFPINVQLLLDDVKAYLKTKPAQIDWQQINVQDIGYRLVQQNQTKYLGEKAASWSLDVKPADDHFDSRITVTAPLRNAGAYLVKANLAGGNESRIILWVTDTLMVKKPIAGKTMYYVADAVTGKPVAKANVEFFGYRFIPKAGNQHEIEIKNFAEFTNEDGLVYYETPEAENNFQWLVTARTDAGRLAYLGFTNMWRGQVYDADYNAMKAFMISDRPVYRPNQAVHFKFWVRTAKYDQEDTSELAGKEYLVEMHNPKGEKVLEKTYKSDDWAGFEDTYELPADAPLGQYQVYVFSPNRQQGFGGGNFRVEEYKKPEYEVTIEAPKEPVMLGEKITAMVKANYYFGAPVQHAKVKYKVLRTTSDKQWYPTRPWDWMYGEGYWWFSQDYDWYPGWHKWGCRAPYPWYHYRQPQQPEVVIDAEAEIREDGTLPIEIDTAVAKAIHPDQDHQYSITAEVVDASRRTIVGTGNVMVARKPFQVVTWTTRGYYRVGDTIEAHVQARRLDGKPVAGKGKLELRKITYDKEGKPSEAVVQKYNLDTDDTGMNWKQLKASEGVDFGQYRLTYTLVDKEKHTIEGATVFTIIGEGFDGSEFRFNDLEIVADAAEYKPGQKANLQFNTDRVGATVLVFERPTNGVYLAPKVLRLEGKSGVHALDISKKDMPNIFVEALTIHGGRVHTEAKQLVVPPEKRILDVDVVSASHEYKPGEKGQFSIKLKDAQGKPFLGTTVVTMYDKSVEYISGGSNVPDIKEFYWKWSRQHHPQTETDANRFFNHIAKQNERQMGNIGVFGHLTAPPGKGEQLQGQGSTRRELRESAKALGDRDGMPLKARPGAALANGGYALADEKAATGANAAYRQDAAVEREADDAGGPGNAGAGGLAEATVRKNFADTAYWTGAVTTNEQGVAEFSLNMPENLTTWKIKAWGMGHGTKVGSGDAEVVTRKNLILRMQTPRFAVQRDEVVLSANVHNYLKLKKNVTVRLELEGECLAALGAPETKVAVEAGGETRVDWRVRVLQEGTATIRMKALTDEESDAMQMTFPVYVHGMLKLDSLAGVIRPDDKGAKFVLNVPAERRVNQTRMEIRWSPSLAGAVVDAVPFLVDYPYDTTDVTLNRFIPTVIAQKVLLDLKVDLATVRDKRTNLNSQELGDPQTRAAQWKRYDRNPVFDEAEVLKMSKAGLARLAEMQLSDGGWGWFSGYHEYSDPHTTALVVHGLQLAKQNDLPIVPGVVEKGLAWLTNYQNKQVDLLKKGDEVREQKAKHQFYKLQADQTDAFVFMVLTDHDVKNADMLNYLYRDRIPLPVYAKAMYALALHKLGEKDKLDMLQQNIAQFVEKDDENQTAWLRMPESGWWYWWNSEIEAGAYYLRLLSRTDPKGELASRFVKYLLNNRKNSTYWTSPRDTAICIESIAEYMRASGEIDPDLQIEVLIDGEKKKELKITRENLFTFDDRLVLLGEEAKSGKREIEIRKGGRGPLYWNAYLTNFTLEDPITKAGLEIKVQRKIYKLHKVDKKIKVSGSRGQAVDQKVEKYERELLKDNALLTSGDLVEIELEIDSKNDYEKLVFEDMKGAGFEPVDVRSGYVQEGLMAYRELRDERVTFFVRVLARGKHSISYRMRAEIPGKFSALPAKGFAMYAPELKGNSDEQKLQVKD